ncbi:MAG: hypothetical protein M3R16_10775 [Pseudomonadota bacterium]|nr:hypothetical protein [Pseudomonadota bacterium]MDQ3040262.1 hypothetical protein [Pseudomonadota bacterium]
MNWISIIVIILGVWLALKVVGTAFKAVLWLVVIAAAYWFLAPYLGLPKLF